MHDRAPGGPATPIRVAGPALVLVIGSGADRAAVRAFAPEELVESDGDLGPSLESDRIAAVTMERYDAATVRLLVAVAQERDRPVDAILVGDAAGVTLPPSRFRAITVADAPSFVLDRVPGAFDRRDLAGPFDVVGDVHGCLDDLVALLAVLGYAVERDDAGRPVGARHPAGRRVVLVGDLVDRGPDVPGVLRLVMGLLASGDGLAVVGNHDDALRRALLGVPVSVDGGLDVSLRALAPEPAGFRRAVADLLGALPAHLLLDRGRLVVAHAGLEERYHGRESARVRSLCLFGPTNGDADEQGMPVRLRWADDYRGAAVVVYGHTPTAEPRWVNRTICVDTGCVFGGSLTAVRYPERTVVAVPAIAEHSAPVRPFLPTARPRSAALPAAVRAARGLVPGRPGGDVPPPHRDRGVVAAAVVPDQLPTGGGRRPGDRAVHGPALEPQPPDEGERLDLPGHDDRPLLGRRQPARMPVHHDAAL